MVEFTECRGDYGLQICARLEAEPMTPMNPSTGTQLWAFYAHLSLAFCKGGEAVGESQVIGLTGNSGNASNVPPHLHFEIRTQPRAHRGLVDRVDPGKVLGFHTTCLIDSRNS